MKDNKEKKILLDKEDETSIKDFACIYCHQKGNKSYLACINCLFDGNQPTEEEIKMVKDVWDSGVIVRKIPQAPINLLKILKQMIEVGDVITGSRICDKHNQLELILGDKGKEYCVEGALGSLVKYETNENILKEIERRKQKGLGVEGYDKPTK